MVVGGGGARCWRPSRACRRTSASPCSSPAASSSAWALGQWEGALVERWQAVPKRRRCFGGQGGVGGCDRGRLWCVLHTLLPRQVCDARSAHLHFGDGSQQDPWRVDIGKRGRHRTGHGCRVLHWVSGRLLFLCKYFQSKALEARRARWCLLSSWPPPPPPPGWLGVLMGVEKIFF